jgi:UDP-glucose 4-epimerase
MRVLITGVAGLLGSRLADWIVGHYPEVEVHGVDDLSGGYVENINSAVTFYKRDLSVPENVHDVFEMVEPHIVYHFAAYAAEGLSPFIRNYNYTNNLISTTNIVNECIRWGVQRLVFTSSMAVYGSGNPPFEESDDYNPIDPYGVAKMACEMDIKIAGEYHGLDWCIIRPHNVYGVKQNIWDAYRNVLGIWMFYSLNDKPITVYGDGTQTRAFSFIDDSLEPLWRAGTDPKASKQIINLGGTQEIAIMHAASVMQDVTGNDRIVFLPQRHEVKHAWSTYQKSIDILGFEHTTSLYDGLIRMWEWAQRQPRRERFVWSNYELDVGLYPFWKPENLK